MWGYTVRAWIPNIWVPNIRVPNTLEYQTFWSSDFQCFSFGMDGHSNSYSYGTGHSKTEPFKNWTIGNPNKMASLLFGFPMTMETTVWVCSEDQNTINMNTRLLILQYSDCPLIRCPVPITTRHLNTRPNRVLGGLDFELSLYFNVSCQAKALNMSNYRRQWMAIGAPLCKSIVQ